MLRSARSPRFLVTRGGETTGMEEWMESGCNLWQHRERIQTSGAAMGEKNLHPWVNPF